MLREAIRFVPDNAEYRFCLGQVELKNANWIERGLENLMEAARLEPKRQQYLRRGGPRPAPYGRKEDALLFARRAVIWSPRPRTSSSSISSWVVPRSPPRRPPGWSLPPSPSRPRDDREPRKAAEKSRSGFLSRLFRRRA